MKRTRLILLIVAVILIVMTGFFVFTATMSSPTHMQLYIPKDGKDTTNYLAISPKLTIILQGNNMIYGYYGNNIGQGKSYNIEEIHKVILDGVNKYSKDSLFILIKPDKKASYKNTVDILDEMTINNIKNYAMIDMDEDEKKFLAKIE